MSRGGAARSGLGVRRSQPGPLTAHGGGGRHDQGSGTFRKDLRDVYVAYPPTLLGARLFSSHRHLYLVSLLCLSRNAFDQNGVRRQWFEM